MGKETMGERRTEVGYDQKTIYAYIRMSHYIVPYSEGMVATTIIVITIKDS